MKIFSRILCIHLIYLITSALISNDGEFGQNSAKTPTPTTTTTTTSTWTSTSEFIINNLGHIIGQVVKSMSMVKGADALCIMREPVSSLTRAKEDPLAKTWYNGKYELEPKPLTNPRYLEDFKKMCAPLYWESGGDDNMPLCCSDNQIPILKTSLVVAEQLIGACAPCFLNFRMIWCQMTCSPNQTDFLIPIEHEIKPYQNFSKYEEVYAKHVGLKTHKQDNSRSSKFFILYPFQR